MDANVFKDTLKTLFLHVKNVKQITAKPVFLDYSVKHA
jgi:hypothetical protein